MSVRRPTSVIPERMLCHHVVVLCQLGLGGGLCGGNVLATGDAVGDVHLLNLRKLSVGQYTMSRKLRSREGEGVGSQSAANVAMAMAANAKLIAFHTATAQALVAKNGDKDSKLTMAKKSILQACCGHADKDTFETLVVYLDMDVEKGTTDALGRIL